MLTLYTGDYNYSKRRCQDAVNWFIKKYLPKHKIEITVNHRGPAGEGVYGYRSVVDCNWRPLEFAESPDKKYSNYAEWLEALKDKQSKLNEHFNSILPTINGFVGVLIEAIKELSAEVKELKKKI